MFCYPENLLILISNKIEDDFKDYIYNKYLII